MQDLTPEVLEDTSFSYSVWGYKRVEVDEYIDQISRSWADSLDGARERAFKDLGERMGGLLQHAKEAADEIVAEAIAEAGRLRAGAETKANGLLEATKTESTKIREAARVHAEGQVDQAEKKVQALSLEEAHVRDRISELRNLMGELADRLSSVEPQTLVIPDEAPALNTQKKSSAVWVTTPEDAASVSDDAV